MTIKLPKDPINILDGRIYGVEIHAALTAAFWVHDADPSRSLFLLEKAHKNFADLAGAMGYTIARNDAAEITDEAAA